MDYAVFDFAINSGPARVVKMLQKVVGVDQDGIICAKTLAAVRKMAADRIINELCDARLAWLKGLGTFSTFSKAGFRGSRALAFSRDSAPVPSLVPQVPTGKAVRSDIPQDGIIQTGSLRSAWAAGYLTGPLVHYFQAIHFPLPPDDGTNAGLHAAAFVVGACGM